MSIIGRLISKFKKVALPPPPPIISTPYGDVTEWARLQAAINMKHDPALKAAVEAKIIAEMGDVEKGEAESRRRYREAY